VLQESLRLEQELLSAPIVMLAHTLEKEKLNAISAVLGHLQSCQHPVVLFARLVNISFSSE
jgi:hypothetical protein